MGKKRVKRKADEENGDMMETDANVKKAKSPNSEVKNSNLKEAKRGQRLRKQKHRKMAKIEKAVALAEKQSTKTSTKEQGKQRKAALSYLY